MQHDEWMNTLLENLAETGEEGREAVVFIRAHKTKIRFWRASTAIGAFWTIFGNIRINSRFYSKQTSTNDPQLLNLIAHEVRHLRQGVLTALSVYGELEAWQEGFRVYQQVSGQLPKHPAIEDLMELPFTWNREILRDAVRLMQAYAKKGYRIDLLPLYPLPAEIRFRLTGKILANN
ncbi:MAG: hypothetical protein QGM50_05360 [Anaerolineae bacterium]|nr:hypothetical protein [Anaerolineae bacterium]MDK1080525.1 hypothetical protein [Anaerolineae bacterium]MDK1118204.1 hypothetical protein [Anaerolineae bacterium]